MARSSQPTLVQPTQSAKSQSAKSQSAKSQSAKSQSAKSQSAKSQSAQPTSADPAASQASPAEKRLSKAQLLKKIQQLPTQKQVELFSDWIKVLAALPFEKILESIQLEHQLRQEFGDAIPGRTAALTEIFLKKITHRRRHHTETTPPQLYVYIRRRRRSSESGTKYLGKLFFIPGGQNYQWQEGADGSIAFTAGNVFQLTHLRNKEQRYIRLLKLDQPPPDYDYDPRATGKLSIQVDLHVEFLHPQSFQPTEVRIYDYPSCMYKNGELADSTWHIEPFEIESIASAQAAARDFSNAHPSQAESQKSTRQSIAPRQSIATRQSIAPRQSTATRQSINDNPDKVPSIELNSQTSAPTTVTIERTQALHVLPLLRQFRDLSQQVYTARSHWYLSEPSKRLGGTYMLTTATGKLILSFDTKDWQLTTDHSAQVLARWFYNLCIKVQAGYDRGESEEISLGDRKWLSELLVQLQSVRGKSAAEILRLIFQL